MSTLARKRNVTILILALAVAVINFITMPAWFYSGDSYAIKSEAIHLVRNGEFGFSGKEELKLGDFLQHIDQYYLLNKKTGEYHNRWGFFNLMLSSLPELANIGQAEPLLDSGTLYADQRSILAHNIFNIILSVILAVFLYKSAGLFTRSSLLRLFLVLATLYASFTWNYMRAQSYEIVHLTLFTIFFYYYCIFLRTASGKRSFASYRSFYFYNLALAGLCLSKAFYFFLYPVLFIPICAKLLNRGRAGVVQGLLRNRQNLGLVILGGVITMAVFLLLSYWFYGEIFFGYLQNKPHTGQVALSWRYIPQRLHDYLISENRSLFVHMPLLIPGLAALPPYWRRHPYEAGFLLGAFLFAFTYFSFCYTVGEWCYGPRFFLFLLPVMCLPTACLFERFVRRKQYAVVSALAAAMLAVSVISVSAQMQVNSRNFHLRYLLAEYLRRNLELPPEIDNYFRHANFAVIARDTNLLLAGKHTGFLVIEFGKYFPHDKKAELFRILRNYIAARFPGNYYLRFYHLDERSPG